MRSWAPFDQILGRDEFEAELRACEDALSEDFVEIGGHSLHNVLAAIVESYQSYGNETGLAALLKCTPMEAYRIERRLLPRILAHRPKLLRALAQASGVTGSGVVDTANEERRRMSYKPMDEDAREQVVAATFDKFEQVFRDHPYEEIVVEFTGSVQSMVLLHMVWRYFRGRNMRVTPFFASTPIDPLPGIHEYMKMIAAHYGLDPIEIHFLTGMEGLFFEQGRKAFAQEVVSRVGPGDLGLGFRYVMRAVPDDPVFDLGPAFAQREQAEKANKKDRFASIVYLLADWSREAVLGYIDHHQLDVYQPARMALELGGRLAFPGSRDDNDPIEDVPVSSEIPATPVLVPDCAESVELASHIPDCAEPVELASHPSEDGWAKNRGGKIRQHGRLVKRADIPAEIVAFFAEVS